MLIGRPRRRHVLNRHKFISTAPQSESKPLVIDERNKPTSQSKRWQKPVLFAVVGGLVFIVAWLFFSGLIAYSKVVDTNFSKRAPLLTFLGDIAPNQLQGEGDGRINILLIGIGGGKHPGGTLADTIMVASLDPKNKEVAFLSIPRDLYVPIDGHGMGKINTAHAIGEQKAKKEGGGPAVLKKTVSVIIDLPIHYYVRVDFQGLEKIVDTLGGVTVTVEKPIVDLSYPADNMIDYSPFRLAAGVQKLNGKTALKYARSRHAAGSEGSDFARAHRQQILLSAIRDSALSTGVLANPKKIASLITILGDHVKTDMSVRELERLIQHWKGVEKSKIFTKVLDNGASGSLISHSGDERGYILLPRVDDYSEIQQIAHEIFTDPYLREEKASIQFVNASGNSTLGRQVMAMLKSYGYQVTDVTAKDEATVSKTMIVDITGEKPYTKKFLESRFKTYAKMNKNTAATHDINLTLGSDYRLPKVRTIPKKASPTPSLLPTPAASDNPTPQPEVTDEPNQ